MEEHQNLRQLKAFRRILFKKKESILTRLAVSVAVIVNKQVLLTLREDFEVWCLPSGGVELGEVVGSAAIRETKEETGLDVKLTGLVGIYSRIGVIPDIHAVHFSAVPIGGEFKTQPGETLDVRYFPVDDLPREMIFGHKRRIMDSLLESSEGKLAIHRFEVSDNGPISRDELYRLRDDSGMSRSEFYLDFFSSKWLGDEEFPISS